MRFLFASFLILGVAGMSAQQTPAKPPSSSHQAASQRPTDHAAPPTPPGAENGVNKAAADKHDQIGITSVPEINIKRDRFDHLYLLLNALLVLIGGLTFGAIWYQAMKTADATIAMQGQVTEMSRQREVMFGQLRTMQEQVTEISSQTDVLERSVAAANKSADAALLNAQVLVHSERPWVLIEESVTFPAGAGAIRRGHIYFRAKNFGRNPARVTRYCCDFSYWVYGTELPDEPEYHQTELMYPKYLVPGAETLIDDFDCDTIMTPDFWDAMNQQNQRLLFIGHVVYFDLSTGDERETRFCYSYTPHGTLIMQGPRSYNQHT